MSIAARIYRRTEAGRRVWETQQSGVPIEYRRLLGVIVEETHADVIRRRLSRFSDEEVSDMLEDLENLGLLESQQMDSEQDLDFTGSFSFDELSGGKPQS